MTADVIAKKLASGNYPSPYAGEIITRTEASSIGLKAYFTGLPCKYGHVGYRYVSTRQCSVCIAERASKWWKAHPEKRRARSANWMVANPNKASGYSAKWRLANPDKVVASSARYRASHSEELRAYDIQWKAQNPELVRTQKRNRSARKKSAEGTHKAADISKIRALQKDKCIYCHVKLKGRGHVDHIVALAKGGTNWPSNLQLLCAPCNLRKNAKDPIVFAQQRGMLL